MARTHRARRALLNRRAVTEIDDISNGTQLLGSLIYVGLLAAIALLFYGFLPHWSPLTLGMFWETNGSFANWLGSFWPFLLWGVGVTAYVSINTRNKPHRNRQAERYWRKGLGASIIAGVFEEIGFRWLLFLAAVMWVQILDFVLLGFAGVHIIEWLHLYVLGPLANFVTLGLLEDWIFYPGAWFVGAAMLYANARFRDGHKYQGLVGLINSWVIGMALFFLMLTYGLLVAILMHTLYDALLFTVRYVDRVIERRRGHI